MISKWERFRAWARLIATLIIIVAGLLVVILNRNNTTDVWLFHNFRDVSVLWIIVVTVGVTLLLQWVVRGTLGAYIRIRQYRRQKSAEDK